MGPYKAAQVVYARTSKSVKGPWACISDEELLSDFKRSLEQHRSAYGSVMNASLNANAVIHAHETELFAHRSFYLHLRWAFYVG